MASCRGGEDDSLNFKARIRMGNKWDVSHFERGEHGCQCQLEAVAWRKKYLVDIRVHRSGWADCLMTFYWGNSNNS